MVGHPFALLFLPAVSLPPSTPPPPPHCAEKRDPDRIEIIRASFSRLGTTTAVRPEKDLISVQVQFSKHANFGGTDGMREREREAEAEAE